MKLRLSARSRRAAAWHILSRARSSTARPARSSSSMSKMICSMATIVYDGPAAGRPGDRTYNGATARGRTLRAHHPQPTPRRRWPQRPRPPQASRTQLRETHGHRDRTIPHRPQQPVLHPKRGLVLRDALRPMGGLERAVRTARPTWVVEPRRRWDGLRGRAPRADLACGNLRFERFLAGEFPKLDLRFLAVDSCAELACTAAAGDIDCTYRQIDVLQALLDCDENTHGSACPAVAIAPGSARPAAAIAPGNAPAPEAGPTFDLCASFGFMHHVPGEHLRRRLLDRLLDRTSPGGLLAMSFWQFMSDDRLSRKADQADRAMRAQGRIDMSMLDANDHFLGWAKLLIPPALLPPFR